MQIIPTNKRTTVIRAPMIISLLRGAVVAAAVVDATGGVSLEGLVMGKSAGRTTKWIVWPSAIE